MFPQKLTPQQVAGAIVSPGYAECLKAMQSKRIVLLCVQPERGGFVPKGVQSFQTDKTYYYGADMHGKTMPEEYVTRLALARMPGVENLAPKLCADASVDSIPITLTGILPRSEFQAKTAW